MPQRINESSSNYFHLAPFSLYIVFFSPLPIVFSWNDIASFLYLNREKSDALFLLSLSMKIRPTTKIRISFAANIFLISRATNFLSAKLIKMKLITRYLSL